MLHTPSRLDQRRLQMALVDDSPELFEAYQDNHPRNAESTLKSRPMAASFVVDESSECRFVGLYAVAGWTFRTASELDADPIRQSVMTRFRAVPFNEWAIKTGQNGREVFNLQLLPSLADLRGRLIVTRPSGRPYMRLAENCELPVIAVERSARFSPPAPNWKDFVVTGDEMRGLPRDWQARLREWRGIYHIVDASDGARYIGAAYGEANLLGRWQAHVDGEIGVTVELAQRDPSSFRFSILELVAPTAPADLVLQAEVNWKVRLDTRTWGLNR